MHRSPLGGLTCSQHNVLRRTEDWNPRTSKAMVGNVHSRKYIHYDVHLTKCHRLLASCGPRCGLAACAVPSRAYSLTLCAYGALLCYHAEASRQGEECAEVRWRASPVRCLHHVGKMEWAVQQA